MPRPTTKLCRRLAPMSGDESPDLLIGGYTSADLPAIQAELTHLGLARRQPLVGGTAREQFEKTNYGCR
jgi:hypothetical protein